MNSAKNKYYRVVPAFGKFLGKGFFVLLFNKSDNMSQDVLDGLFSDEATADKHARKLGLIKKTP